MNCNDEGGHVDLGNAHVHEQEEGRGEVLDMLQRLDMLLRQRLRLFLERAGEGR